MRESHCESCCSAGDLKARVRSVLPYRLHTVLMRSCSVGCTEQSESQRSYSYRAKNTTRSSISNSSTQTNPAQQTAQPSTRPAALHTGKHCITVIFISPACKINPLMFVTFLSFLFLSCSIFFNIHFPLLLISFFLFNSFLLFCFLFAFLSCCFLA